MNREAYFDEITTEHQDKIYRICAAYLYDKSLVEDLMQEVLIHIWNALPNFRGDSQLTTWVYRITVNSAITFNKKEKKRSETLVGDLDEQTADNPQIREEKIALETRIEKLHEAIGTLPEYERIIIGLVLEDLSYKEISNILGLSTNLIGVKINRIKKKLSTLLNEPS